MKLFNVKAFEVYELDNIRERLLPLCNEAENTILPVYDGLITSWVIMMTREGEEALEKLNKKCGVAFTDKASHILKELIFDKDINTWSDSDQELLLIKKLDEYIEYKIFIGDLIPIKDREYYILPIKSDKNFCHNSAHEALYYYYLDRLNYQDFKNYLIKNL